jgi:hypothetical protein
MEIEHFIEKDIQEFLELRRSQDATPIAATPRREGVLAPEEMTAYTLGRDFVMELEKWLRDRDFAKAKRTLQDLKEKIASFPAEAPERVEGKRLFESLYSDFEKALAEEQKRDASFPDDAAARPPLPRDRARPSQTEERKPVGLSEAQELALAADLEHLKMLIFENSFVAAIKSYQEIRLHLLPENLSPEQRTRLLPRLRSLYHLMHERLTAQDLAAPFAPEPAGDKPSTDNSAVGGALAVPSGSASAEGLPDGDTEGLRLFSLHRDAAERALESERIAEAMRHYNILHEVIASLSIPGQDASRRDILSLYEQINALYTKLTAAPAAPSRTASLVEREEQKLTGAP